MQTQNEGSPQTAIHWPSLLQLAFSLLAALGGLAFASLFGVEGIATLFSSQGVGDQTASLFVLAAAAGLGAVLLLPSAWYAFQRLIGRTYPWVGRVEAFASRVLNPAYLILLFPLVLIAGYFITKVVTLTWLGLPPLHLLAVGLPLLWLASLGWHRLPVGSRQRAWGIFGVGLVLGPGLIFMLEIAALLAIFIFAVIYMAFNPSLVNEINALAQRLSQTARTPEDILPLVRPYLSMPIVLYAILAYLSGIVPLIEETLKPIGVWLMAGADLLPAEGFVAGLLSGLGYALFESLALSATTAESWIVIVVTRVGTGLLHILTSGLTGWAMVSSWRDGRYYRLSIVYLVGIMFHGLWNALALLSGAPALFPGGGAAVSPALSYISLFAIVGLFTLALVMFVVLISANAYLKRSLTPVSHLDIKSKSNEGIVENPIQ